MPVPVPVQVQKVATPFVSTISAASAMLKSVPEPQNIAATPQVGLQGEDKEENGQKPSEKKDEEDSNKVRLMELFIKDIYIISDF